MKWIRRLLILLLILITPLLLAGLYVYWNRNELKDKALQALKSETGALISVQDARFELISSFPNFVLQLDSVVVSDSNLSIHQTPVLQLAHMELKSSLVSLLLGSISIESIRFINGAIRVEKYDSASHNFLFFNHLVAGSEQKTKTGASEGIFQFHIRNLEWDHVSFDYNDMNKEKRIRLDLVKVNQVVTTSDSVVYFTLQGDIQVGMLGFNLAKGTFVTQTLLTADFTLQWNGHKQELSWNGSKFLARQHPFEVNGRLQVSDPLVLDLRIKTKGVLEKDVLPMLTQKIAKRIAEFEVLGPIDAEARIGGPILPGEDPETWIQFEGKHQRFNAHYMDQSFDLEHFKGFYHNQVDSTQLPGDENSKLKLTHVSGVWHEYPFLISGEIRDFKSLFLNGNVQITLGQKQMALLCKSLPFNPIQSLGWIKAKYHGRIDDLISSQQNFGIGQWKGLAYFQVKEAGWKGSELNFTNLAMKCTIDGDSFRVRQLNGELNGNRISAQGSMLGMAHHFSNPENPVWVKLSAQTPFFDVNKVISGNPKPKRRSKSHSNASGSPDSSTYQLNMQIALEADKVRFQKLDCRDLKGELNLSDNRLKLTKLKFKTGGGTIALDASIDDLTRKRKKLQSSFVVSRVDVKRLFRGMNQFGQNVCKAENIDGKLDLEGTFGVHLNQDYDLKPETMKGDFSFQLKGAKLIDFKPLTELSGFLLPKESLQEIQLATLSNTFHLNGRTLTLDEMEIPTSLATFYLQGEYDFANKLDMSILVPYHTISRKNHNEIIKRGLRDKDRPSIPIRVLKKDGKVTIGLDKDRAKSRFWKRMKKWTG